jgi:hypothetical protein
MDDEAALEKQERPSSDRPQCVGHVFIPWECTHGAKVRGSAST